MTYPHEKTVKTLEKYREFFLFLEGEGHKIVMVSGGFDPVHPGHVSYLKAASLLGSALFCVVNGDWFLTQKKGRPFMPLEDRCYIMQHLNVLANPTYGHYTIVPFEIEGDMTVNLALSIIKPHVFAKGGDRVDENTIPEWDTCNRNNIEIVTGVGAEKKWSSSNYLRDWDQHKDKTMKVPI